MTEIQKIDYGPARLAKSFYFFYFAALASLSPFLVLYYEQLGFSGRQIGLLAGLPPILILLGASLWGGIADATQKHKQVLALAIGATMAFVLTLSTITTFLMLIPVVVGLAFFMAPINPLVDNSVMELLGDRKERYGRIRLWGAVGWGAAGPIIGWLVEHFGQQWSFYGFLISMLGCLLIAFRLPVAHSHIGGAFWRGFRTLIADRQWRLFLFLAFITGMGLATVNHFLFLYMNHIGASQSVMGLALTIATASEMVIFFCSDRLLQRWGRRRLLLFAMLATAVRILAYSTVRVPELALAVQLLHGPSFALMWVAGVSYASGLAPAGLGATAQGLFTGVNFGLGGAAGALIGGVLYEQLGPLGMYRWAGIWVLLGLLFFVVASRLMAPSRPDTVID